VLLRARGGPAFLRRSAAARLEPSGSLGRSEHRRDPVAAAGAGPLRARDLRPEHQYRRPEPRSVQRRVQVVRQRRGPQPRLALLGGPVPNPTVSRIARRAGLTLAFVAAAVGCAKLRPLTAPSPQPGQANFSRYVAMGTAISAGFQSGGLAQRHQVLAFPYLFAKQAGATTLTYPSAKLARSPPPPTPHH